MGAQKGKRKLRWPKWYVAIMAVILIAFSVTMVHRFRQLDIVKNDIVAAQNQLKEVQQENDELKKEQQELSDNSRIERIAREELGMSKQGEMPYIYNKNMQSR